MTKLLFYDSSVAVEEENELDLNLPRGNHYDKLTELQRHQIKHRELFLSRQIETYKIDMVRYVCVYIAIHIRWV